jgi:hypothetical protein
LITVKIVCRKQFSTPNSLSLYIVEYSYRTNDRKRFENRIFVINRNQSCFRSTIDRKRGSIRLRIDPQDGDAV